MKKISENTMRQVDGGIRYRTHCGATFTDKSPWTLIKGLIHICFCSDCMAAKRVWGYWYTFDSKEALKRAWK